jgi:hypothetical protein
MVQARPSFGLISIIHPNVNHFNLPKSGLVVRVAVRCGSHLHAIARITSGSIVNLHLLLATLTRSTGRVAILATLLSAKVWLTILRERHVIDYILQRDLLEV